MTATGGPALVAARQRLPAHILAALTAQPWMTITDLATWTGHHPGKVRAAVHRLLDAGRLVRARPAVPPWSPCPVIALVAAPAAARQRLLRLEQTRVVTHLLARLDPGGRHGLRAALRDEAGGPPPGLVLLQVADVQRQGVLRLDRLTLDLARPFSAAVAGLADGWLVTASGQGALLVRWDAGDGNDLVERAWLTLVGRLHRAISGVAIVCARVADLGEWQRRWQSVPQAPALFVACAADLAEGGFAWYDGPGRLVPRLVETPADALPVMLTPVPFRLPVNGPMSPPRPVSAGMVAQRLRLSGTALACLHAIAREPMISPAALAADRPLFARGAAEAPLSAGRLRQALAEVLAPGLVGRVAGTPPGLYLTPAGLRFLAALAGREPAFYRRLTVVHAGRMPTAPDTSAIRLTRSTPRLRRARQHLRHTQGTIRLRRLMAGRVSQGPGQPVALIGAWQGPLCRSLRFGTADGALQTRNARTGGRMPYGRVYPDARAVLVLGARLIDLIVEWDRGRTNLQTLREKLPYYLAWVNSPAGQDGLVLFVTSSVRREQQIHTIVRQQGTGQPGRRWAPILTTSLALLEADGVFGPIWAESLDTTRRQPLLTVVGRRERPRPLARPAAASGVE